MFITKKHEKEVVELTYNISIPNPTNHCFEIELLVTGLSYSSYEFSMAAWIPGSYMIRDLAKNIVSIEAFDLNKSSGLELIKLDKSSWRVNLDHNILKLDNNPAKTKTTLVIKYVVYAFDTAPRGAYIDNTKAFFDGARIFLKLHGFETSATKVNILKPVHIFCDAWKLFTSMPPIKIDNYGFGSYLADNYWELIDHPFFLGDFEQHKFTVHNISHEVVLPKMHKGKDIEKLMHDVQKICEGNVKVFNELPLKSKYVFFLNILNGGYGGIEHKNSTSLLCSMHNLPNKHANSNTVEYVELLGLFSHEYFHLWNVKRIKPLCFMEPNLQAEVYTEQLWIFEGITAYYESLVLVKNNIISRDAYLNNLSIMLNSALNNPGIKKQTLADSSFYAWNKFYKQDENSPNALISYYKKGALVALCLDLMIIKDTKCKYSLQDIMSTLWSNYGKVNKGLPHNEFEKIVNRLTGIDYSQFFNLALNTTEDLPTLNLLNDFGIEYTVKETDILTNFGIKIQKQYFAKVLVVFNNTMAEASGLAPFDEIMAINGTKVNANAIDKELLGLPALEEFYIHVFRHDELIELKAFMPDKSNTVYELKINQNQFESQNQNHNQSVNQNKRENQNQNKNEAATTTMELQERWLGEFRV